MQKLHYTVFSRTVDGEGRIINTAIATDDLVARLPYALTFELPYQAAPNGMPVQGELQRMTGIEDKAEAALRSEGAVHIGHVVGGGKMKVVFYSPKAGPKSLKLSLGVLKKLDLALESRHDPSWQVYHHELQPTDDEIQAQRDTMLLKTLAEHGDVASTVRPVDFAALFPTEAQREAFIKGALANGFRMGKRWTDDEGRYWCELTKDLSLEVIRPEVLAFLRSAKSHGGEFDGWACPVAK